MENDIKKIQFKSHIEICEMSEQDLAGRTKIIMTALEICKDKNEWNKNGICWLEQYVQDNLDSIIGSPFVTSWADEENQIPYDHGDMTYDDDGNVQFDGVTVGSIQEGYIEERKLDGETKKVLTVKGYIYNQRYPKFIEWLRSETNETTVYGSIEINGKGKNKDIIYLDGNKNSDGTLKMGRIPQIFDFSGLAILSSLCEPADVSSQVIEVNSKLDNKNIDINILETCIKKDLIGTESSLKIDKSKDSLSDDSWGDVDKSILNKKCFLCSNWKTVCKAVFMKLEDGWEEGKEGSLKYPIMQLKNDTFVYNKGALASALTYAKKQNETEVINKVEKIRKNMGIDDDSTETNSILNNHNQKGEEIDMGFVKKGQVVEVNNLEVYDIEKMLLKAFLITIGCFEHSCDYWISYLYPLNSEFIVEKYNCNGNNYQYYKTSYIIDETAKTVTLGDIYEVERSWTPVNNEKPIELNANKKKINDVGDDSTKINEGGNKNMEENKKVEELNTKIGELNAKNTKKDAKITELNAKIVELNEAIVNANKSVEELNTKIKDMEKETSECKTEVNTYKEKYESLEKEKAVVEANTYFETEIKKNGFEEVEVNSLKDFVSKGDLDGLKKAEAELCAKKFKEMISKSGNEQVETNSSKGLENMIKIKEEKIEKSAVEEGKSLFM